MIYNPKFLHWVLQYQVILNTINFFFSSLKAFWHVSLACLVYQPKTERDILMPHDNLSLVIVRVILQIILSSNINFTKTQNLGFDLQKHETPGTIAISLNNSEVQSICNAYQMG